ncbi:hypothetical protein JCM1841_006694 [Sporobolomyces salmonicolor]
MATASNEMTQHAESAGDGPYKPSEHGGQKKDGSPDKRVSSEHGFGGNKELAHEAGKKGGSVTGDQMAH